MIWVSKGIKVLCALLMALALAASVRPHQPAYAFTSQVIQKGATGLDVVELQARLQYIGYYRDAIDGVFGWNTYWALRKFQKNYGLKVDGLAGLKTRQKLVSVSKYDEQWVRKQLRLGRKFTYYGGVQKSNQTSKKNQTPTKKAPASPPNKAPASPPSKAPASPTNKGTAKAPPSASNKTPNQTPKKTSSKNGSVVMPAQNVPEGFSKSDIQLMTRMVFAEAKGEPFIGQVAVAAVIINRINSPKFPNTVPAVIYQPAAFTSVQNGELWAGTPDKQAKKAVIDALNGWDPSDGALYYFNPAKASNGWIWSRPQIKKIGKHIFTE